MYVIMDPLEEKSLGWLEKVAHDIGLDTKWVE